MLEVQKISKKAGDFSLKDISFTVSSGEYFVLLGESGAGKTMLLEIIAGLRKADSGSIILDHQDITRVKPNKRGVGLVFQDGAVFPHLTVEKNIAYSLHGRGLSAAETLARVRTLAGHMNIDSLLHRKPQSLSGGELRRVALARTLAMEPAVLLLDEPLSSLDILIHYDMIRLLKKLHESGQTIIHVTHDYNEAYSLADTLAIINAGKIEQAGTPNEVFNKPASRFVSAMTGIRNFFTSSQIIKNGDLYQLTLKEGIPLYSSLPVRENGSVFVREEEVKLSREQGNEDINIFEGTVTDIIPSPGYLSLVVDAGIVFFARINSVESTEMKVRIGEKVRMKISPEAVIPVDR
ncbi:MAG TPA: ABC transporter ATP-binding protein [Bacteroidales bacterium]|nr:ABC transporter ATP-binding protein [Bacteroidales bacterium]HNZ41907.1 ABC transporter ATP-binding protein [Bacteroidales bacterium]HPB25804.1 ABC transporter ATP-binding protein [Bacteroidales bacterium]HPI29461.1 ABC transporter ATP-binding protein [Bacteroidales bacterium]HQN16412.1 ABC transporter ATP-binding protein [Bacteroidales bacterium]